MPPLVSILVPTYNRPHYLRLAIESALAQDYPSFEVVVADNSDWANAAQNVLAVATLRDRRLRYYHNGSDLGATGSGNRLMKELARGEYLKFLMDDDLLRPNCVSRLADALSHHPSAGVATAPMDIVDGAGGKVAPRMYLFSRVEERFRWRRGDQLVPGCEALREFLTSGYPCCVPTGWMARRDALLDTGGSQDRHGFAGDLGMCMRMAVDWDFAYVDEALASWRYVPDCHTARMHRSGVEAEVFYGLAREFLADADVLELFAGEDWIRLARDAYFFCSCRALLNVLAAARSGSPALATKALATVLRNDPHWSNWLRLPLWAAKQAVVR
jgi:glycosyltransferase involved in cell wall biosynthesis